MAPLLQGAVTHEQRNGRSHLVVGFGAAFACRLDVEPSIAAMAPLLHGPEPATSQQPPATGNIEA